MNNLFSPLLLKMLRTFFEKVIIQSIAYFVKQRHRNPLLVENLVKILRGAVYLPRQPYCRATLPGKLLLDGPPDMEAVGCCLAFHTVCFI